MKTKLIISALLILSACATQSVSEQVANKSPQEKAQYLLEECKDESWRGHDTGKHRHYNYRPENVAHKENVVKICQKLAEQPSNKSQLVAECIAEAKNGTFASEFRFGEHAKRLTEICNAF